MEDNMSRNQLTPKQQRLLKKRKKKRTKMVLLIIELLIVLIAVVGLALYLMPNSKSYVTKVFMKCPAGQKILRNIYKDDYEENVMDKNVNEEKIDKVDLGDGYTNIAFFGIDPREGEFESQTHTDSIIIISINNKTYDINMISLYRDTLLRVVDADGDVSYEKANSAFFKNGVEGALSMINNNLDLDITEYALVNFKGLATVIDALGGIDATISEEERELINGYLVETREVTGMDSPDVTESGFVHLNGLQSTAYCRIRYIGNDFQRAQRQRDVLIAASEKAKGASISELNNIVNGVMGNISTSLDVKEILNVMKDLGNYSIVANDGFPFEQYRATGRVGSKGSCVIPQDLAVNVAELHRFLFDENDYQISSEVDEFSKKVSSDTGKYVNTSADEFTKKEKENDEVATSE